jgi:hypothetical protein
VIQPYKQGGYTLTSSVYCQGDRSPSEIVVYEALTMGELQNVLEAVSSGWRPGWEYASHAQQPPLWDEGPSGETVRDRR